MSTTNNYKMAVIGPADTISGLRALGVDAIPAYTGAEVLEQLRTLKKQSLDGAGYAVVCVIEQMVADIDPDEYAKVVAGPLPAVVLLPGAAGGEGLALARLRSLAEKAIGSSII